MVAAGRNRHDLRNEARDRNRGGSWSAPLPSWPNLFSPQQRTVAPATTWHVCALPAEMRTLKRP